MNEVQARLKGARLSAQKARLVADQIRGKHVEEALNTLNFSTKKAANIVKKVLESAIANAEHNEGARKAAGVSNLPFLASFKDGALVEGSAASKEEYLRKLIDLTK